MSSTKMYMGNKDLRFVLRIVENIKLLSRTLIGPVSPAYSYLLAIFYVIYSSVEFKSVLLELVSFPLLVLFVLVSLFMAVPLVLLLDDVIFVAFVLFVVVLLSLVGF